MHIKKLSIRNLKSIQTLELKELTPIVGIWGKNGAGKSTILQALTILRNCIGSGTAQDTINNRGLSMGPIGNIKYKKAANPSEVSISAQIDGGKENSVRLIPDFARKLDDPSLKDRVRYFPPWRRIVPRSSSVAVRITQDLVQNSEHIHSYIHWFLHKCLLQTHRTNTPTELERVNDWAIKIGLGNLVDQQPDHNNVMACFSDSDVDADIPLVDGGYGGNTFLPILLESYSFRDGILLIEEPEISLHSGAQGDLVDFFLEITQTRGHQVIFTSHSSYLLEKIVRWYRDSKDGNVFSILVAEKDGDGTKVDRVPLDTLVERFDARRDLIRSLTER